MTHGSEKRARKQHITIRLTDEERKAIDAAADRAGLTPGSHARQVLLGAPAPRQVRRPPVEKRELARLLGELGRVGSNLNQIARSLNMDKDIKPKELETAIRELTVVRDAILSALGRGS